MASGEVLLLLGSNLGRRVRRLREGLSRLRGKVEVTGVSRIYASEPWGRTNQPWFLNMAVRGRSDLLPADLLLFVKKIEADGGRKAAAKWGPRELDIDILLMGDRVVNEPHLVVPHPGLALRRFFLAPACEVAPGAIMPPGGRTVRDLLDACQDPCEVYLI